MLTITQSNDIRHLAWQLSERYQSDDRSVFEPFVVITPAKVLGDWLEKYIAKRCGISTMIHAKFWGQYQWQLMKAVLDYARDYLIDTHQAGEVMSVPEVAMLSQSVLRWKIFGFLLQSREVAGTKQYYFEMVLGDEQHPLHPLLKSLEEDGTIGHKKLWQLSIELSAVYVKYLTLRPNWLTLWADQGTLDVKAMIDAKDKMESFYHQYAKQYEISPDKSDQDDENTATDEVGTPTWLVDHYVELERALAFLWLTLFSGEYHKREALEERFWQVLDGEGVFAKIQDAVKQFLPKKMYLFTVQQIPKIEIDFLKKLSRHQDIELFHFNPSAQFWADTVDKQWLLNQKIINESSVYLKEYGHGLLSRLGKESRQTFAMLADVSGGVDEGADQVQWRDEFVSPITTQSAPTLLDQLKADILSLDETGVHEQVVKQVTQNLLDVLTNKQHDSTTTWRMNHEDNSLSIHSCYSLKRQLEVARQMIVRWLNEPGSDGQDRQLSDIAVFLPDVNVAAEMIKSVFVDGRGLDGFYLPAKITGVADKSVANLWQAIMGFYQLPSTRFYKDVVFDFLMMPEVHQSAGLSFDEMSRGCALLEEAGFRRGFDAEHLKLYLDDQDEDYRFSFAFALDRLVTGLLLKDSATSDMLYPFEWHHGNSHHIAEKTRPLVGISFGDTKIIQALSRIFAMFVKLQGSMSRHKSVVQHLMDLENELIKSYFAPYQGTVQMLSIYDAINGLKMSARAGGDHDLTLPLEFVLESVNEVIVAQQISSEPAGVITFGRFGSLRGIPFKLIIMLDMNLASFPRADYHNRLDLIKAGMRERGDRLNEDDDNGAFLEALLCATEACWIFYTGQAPSSEPLPATPVAELIDFLSHEPKWHLGQESQDGLMTDIKKNLPNLIKSHLITKHSILPFEMSLFERADGGGESQDWLKELAQVNKLNQQTKLPPPKIWQTVYEGIKQPKASTKPLVSWLDGHEIEQISKDLQDGTLDEAWLRALPVLIDVHQMASQIDNPVRAFLLDKMALFGREEAVQMEEPLVLDGLNNWALTNDLLKQDIHQTDKGDQSLNLLYGDDLPAGVTRLTLLENKKQELGELKQLLQKNLEQLMKKWGKGGASMYEPLISPTMSKKVRLDHLTHQGLVSQNLTVQSLIPKDTLWRQLSISKLRSKHLLTAWLSHVVWQMVREPSNFVEDGVSVWQFNIAKNSNVSNEYNGMIAFVGMSQKEAWAEFEKWLNYWAILKNTPIALTTENALIYLANQDEDIDWNALFGKWLKEPHGTVYADCSWHEDWQLLLGDMSAKDALINSTKLAWVYENMQNHMINISE